MIVVPPAIYPLHDLIVSAGDEWNKGIKIKTTAAAMFRKDN